MNIVLEGNDASGKSTLARVLSQRLSLQVIPSEGPEKFPGEIDERIGRYLQYDRVIFDRHPCVSQPIYQRLINKGQAIPDPQLTEDFYKQGNLIVYCRPGKEGFDLHEENPAIDNAAHLAGVRQNYNELLSLYDRWAVERAHFIYRVRQDFEQTVSRICLTYRLGYGRS